MIPPVPVASNAALRLGPPPRSFAADAYVASWSGSIEICRIQACGAIFRRLLASSPQIVRVYSWRIVKCTHSTRKRLPSWFSQDQLMAIQIVAWHAPSPLSPRATRDGARPYGLWGLTAKRGPSRGLPCHEWRAPAFAKPRLSRVPRGRKENVRGNRSSPLTNILPYKQGQKVGFPTLWSARGLGRRFDLDQPTC